MEEKMVKFMADKEEGALQFIEDAAKDNNLSLKEKSQLIRNLYSDAELLGVQAFGLRSTLADMRQGLKGLEAEIMSQLLVISDTDPDSALKSFRTHPHRHMFPELRDLEDMVEQALLMRALGPCDPTIFEED